VVEEKPSGRGVSPVVGVTLLVAIVVFVTSAAGYVTLGLAGETKPAPDVAMEFEPTGDGVMYTLQHVSGEGLTGNQTRLIGVADEDALHGERLRAGQTTEVVPVGTEVTLLWYGDGEGYTLHTFDVDPDELAFDVGTIDNRCDFVEQEMTNNSGDLDLTDEQAVCNVTADVDLDQDDNDLDLDNNSTLIGDIDGDVDLDSSAVVGGVASEGNDITITDESEVSGDVVADTGTNIDIDGESQVDGAVVVDGGSLSLDNVDVDGPVYADPDDVSCSGSTLGPDDESCSEYNYRDPDDY
jgi:FlaG/FlaF family flagellin (archaellin)